MESQLHVLVCALLHLDSGDLAFSVLSSVFGVEVELETVAVTVLWGNRSRPLLVRLIFDRRLDLLGRMPQHFPLTLAWASTKLGQPV